MANILDKIIADKKVEVRQQKAFESIESLKGKCADASQPRNFSKAVTKKNPRGINVIAEVKKASPSAGIIREDFDAVEIAKIYESCGADAISCLTDEKYFQGKLEYIQQIKNAVALPVLRKDFIIDSYQVYQARAAGADAILLIAEALNVSELVDLMILANELKMSTLVEIHSIESFLKIKDMTNLPNSTRNVLGINNRDLSTMKIDVKNTGRIASFLDEPFQLVAESGIKTREDVEMLKKVPANAVLIGQTLCESPSIKDKFNELFESNSTL